MAGITDLNTLMGQGQWQGGQGWQQSYLQPATQPATIVPQYYSLPSKLSDMDIELMAACIANKHPNVEGHNTCFCALKRLEKGIGKE